MRVPIRLGSAVAAAGVTAALLITGALPFAGPAFASTAAPAVSFGGASHAVFVQTDNPSGNRVVAYHRAPDGVLSQAGTYATGGLGGILAGSAVDHLASQGSLSYDPRHSLLYAVNAGSDSVAVFAVNGDRSKDLAAPAQPDHRSTVTARTGPVGGASRYCQYRSASSRNGSAICCGPVKITARPSARTHHSVSQSSEYSSASMVTRGFSLTLRSRFRLVPDFGF